MEGMASISNLSPGKPKLDRRNAKKIDYDPSAPSPSSAFRTLDKNASKSFRIMGYDSIGELDRICEELGVPGGAEAFSIPQEAWEAGRRKAATSRISKSRIPDNRQNIVNALNSSDAIGLGENRGINAGLHHGESLPRATVVHAGPSHEARIRRQDDRDQGDISEVIGGFSRLSNSFDEVPHQAVLPHSIAIRTKSGSHLPSKEELLDNYLPTNHTDHSSKEMNDEDDNSASSSEGLEAGALDDDTKERIGFVLESVLQHSEPGKEQHRAEDGSCLTPQTPLQGNADNISVQSWRKLGLLGSGSFGTVYEAFSEDGVYFAVKEVSLSENDSKAQQCVSQLEQEIEFLSKFHHENIVQYLGAQREPDKLYIFLELVTHGSLSSNYQKYALFDSQIRLYTRQILSGLKYLHERKIMHRDIKCANILVDVSGKVKLADFGLAKQISQLDGLKSCKGSAYWMAPEVINPKQSYSLPADIWSLGCTVLEMITRKPPFGDIEWHRALWKVGHGEAPPIPEDLSDEAKDFIKKCLEVNPLRRPSALQLWEHPFVQYTGRTGFTPKNSFTQDFSALPIITEDHTLSG